MQLPNLLAFALATLAAASPMLEEASAPRGLELEPRACVGNIGRCNKRASAAAGHQCCGGLYCCGIVGSNNVCQTANTCGEPK